MSSSPKSKGSAELPNHAGRPDSSDLADEKAVGAEHHNNAWSPDDFPDGGIEAWLTVAGSSACLFGKQTKYGRHRACLETFLKPLLSQIYANHASLLVSFGWVNCIGVFQDYYQQNQLRDYSTSDVSWIPALQSKRAVFEAPIINN